MPRFGFETTVPASARAKRFHVLDRSVTVTGITLYNLVKITDISKQYAASIFRVCLFPVSCGSLAWLTFGPEDGSDISPKR
jgi:hypothetical protein